MTFGSDVFRCVIGGSYQRAGETVQMGDTLTRAGGRPWEQVVAGPDGLDEVIIVGDRRGAYPEPTGPNPAWAETVGDLVTRLQADLGALAPA